MATASLTMKKGVKLTTVVLSGLAIVSLVTWKVGCDGCLRDVSQAGRAMLPSWMGGGSGAAAMSAESGGVVPLDAKTVRPLSKIEEALFVKGSLRDTEFPVWGTARGALVKPNRALRDRFDYYLLALGEASLAELTALVKAHAERDLGPQAAAQILAVWERYLQLQQHEFKFAAKPGDMNSMQIALQEHQQVRQSILGVDWARAFYDEEEQILAADIEHTRNGDKPKVDPDRALLNPAAGTDSEVLHRQRVERFGEATAQRLQALDEEQAQWDQRIATAKAEIDALRHNTSLSAPQLNDAINNYLDKAFPDATERLRASGLVGL